MTWAPLETPVDVRCDTCSAIYVIHTMGFSVGQKVLSFNEHCSCGHGYGEVIGPTQTDDWPDVIDG